MLRKILFTIGVLLLINTLVLPFISNLNAAVFVQGMISVFVMLYAWFLKKIKRIIHIAVLVLCAIPLMLMAALWVYGNSDSAQYNEDAVIVLGAGIRGELVSRPLAKRLDSAYDYYSKNPQAVIVVCGGQGYQEDISEALAMERYLIAKGVPPEKLLKEERSTSTWENLSNAENILIQRFPEGFSCVVVTNDFHVFRAARLAQQAGLDARHIGVGTDWYTVPNNYTRELLAIGKMIIFKGE